MIRPPVVRALRAIFGSIARFLDRRVLGLAYLRARASDGQVRIVSIEFASPTDQFLAIHPSFHLNPQQEAPLGLLAGWLLGAPWSHSPGRRRRLRALITQRLGGHQQQQSSGHDASMRRVSAALATTYRRPGPSGSSSALLRRRHASLSSSSSSGPVLKMAPQTQALAEVSH